MLGCEGLHAGFIRVSWHAAQHFQNQKKCLFGIDHVSDRKTSLEKCDLGSKLSFLGLRYIVLRYILVAASSAFPWQTACGKPLYTSTSASAASLTAPRFLFQRFNCMVWYDTCQCNCKSQLHHPFSSSETSFEVSLLEEARMSSHSDMLHAFH